MIQQRRWLSSSAWLRMRTCERVLHNWVPGLTWGSGRSGKNLPKGGITDDMHYQIVSHHQYLDRHDFEIYRAVRRGFFRTQPPVQRSGNYKWACTAIHRPTEAKNYHIHYSPLFDVLPGSLVNGYHNSPAHPPSKSSNQKYPAKCSFRTLVDRARPERAHGS